MTLEIKNKTLLDELISLHKVKYNREGMTQEQESLSYLASYYRGATIATLCQIDKGVYPTASRLQTKEEAQVRAKSHFYSFLAYHRELTQSLGRAPEILVE